MDGKRILVVQNKASLRVSDANGLRQLGYRILEADSAVDALEINRAEWFDAILLDLRISDMPGLDCLRMLKIQRPEVAVIALLTHSSQSADALRAGASDCLTRPFHFDDLDQRLRRAFREDEARAEARHLQNLICEKFGFSMMKVRSSAMRKVLTHMRQAARCEANVLLRGRQGTGRGVIARAIHVNSANAAGPFITVNCATIAPSVVDGELFGLAREGGAEKPGLLSQATDGTLFLRECGELPPDVQEKLVRAFRERQARQLGSDKPYDVNCRVIASSGRDLEQDIKEGKLLAEFFNWLNVMPIGVPPLSERNDDMMFLLHEFVRRHELPDNKVSGIEARAYDALLAYHWPGNVSELESTVERVLATRGGEVIKLSHLPAYVADCASGLESRENSSVMDIAEPAGGDMLLAGEKVKPLHVEDPNNPEAALYALTGQQTLDEIEYHAILATLRVTLRDRGVCAKILGIDKSTLYRKLKRYHMAAESSYNLPSQ